MFTGIISAVGTISAVTPAAGSDCRIRIAAPGFFADVVTGASVACSGVCLTLVRGGADFGEFDVSGETLSRTAPAMWEMGARINLERALRVGDELGGHIVTGHVDGVGSVVSMAAEHGSHQIVVAVDSALAPFIAAKGSVALDGISLTVNAVEDVTGGAGSDAQDGTGHRAHFHLNIIPHSWAVTNLSRLCPGAAVNIEIDTLARYLRRMQMVESAKCA